MATYVLIHGAGDSGWYWHLVGAELGARGHEAVAPDLPIEDESAGLADYADAVVEAIGPRSELVVVAQSAGGFTAPLVCERVRVELLVLVAGLIPLPGEKGEDWWANTGYYEAEREPVDPADTIALFYHDVPPELAAEALTHARTQADAPSEEPWPLERWPDVPTRFLLCRQDRLLPAEWLRGVVRNRLGIEPDEIDASHCVALSRPREVADRLEAYRGEQSARAG